MSFYNYVVVFGNLATHLIRLPIDTYQANYNIKCTCDEETCFLATLKKTLFLHANRIEEVWLKQLHILSCDFLSGILNSVFLPLLFGHILLIIIILNIELLNYW